MKRGALSSIDDVFEATPAELLAVAAGADTVSVDEFAAPPTPQGSGYSGASDGPRWNTCRAAGPQPVPGALAELTAALGEYLRLKFTATPTATAPTLTGPPRAPGCGEVTGVPVVAGTVTARLIVSRDTSDALGRVEPGDIVACPYMTAAWNAIFPLLGGIVTEFGGPHSHTAMMAREFGIPCIVGTGPITLGFDGVVATLTVPPAV